MAKSDTVAAIKAANNAELNEGDYTQKELDALLAASGNQAEFDSLKAGYDSDGAPLPEADPNAPNIDGTPRVTAEDGEVKVTQQGGLFVLESRKGDVAYRAQGDNEKDLRAAFKANPDGFIVGK